GQQTDLIASQATITSLQFHPNGQQLLSASEDGTAKLWQITAAPAKQLQQLKSSAPVRQALFTPKGDQITSAGDDKLIHVWNAADGKEIKALAGHQAAVLSVAISSDGAKIISGSADKTVKLWPMPTAATAQAEVKPMASFTLAAVVQSMAISPNGGRIAAA